MLLDIYLPRIPLTQVPDYARSIEGLGFDGLWVGEDIHNPFIPLTLAAEHTERITLGTAICLAFPRSPTITAYAAWDLQALSEGRLILGLGTQIRGHIQRRFGIAWEPPNPKLREYIMALRAIWSCWQNGTPLNFQGKFYRLDLMPPMFNPGAIEQPNIPIAIAGVNKLNCRLAGQLCDGLIVHPLHTVQYLKQLVIPSIEEGLNKAGKARKHFQLIVPVFAATGKNEMEVEQSREFVRSQIAFYGSTRVYRPVLESHGWGELGEELYKLSLKAEWGSMSKLVNDEILEAFAIIGKFEEVPEQIRLRYRGIADRVILYPVPALSTPNPSWRMLTAK